MMKLTSLEVRRIKTETLVIPVCPDDTIHRSPAIRSLIRKALNIDTFKGKKGEELILHQPSDTKARRVLFMGMG